MGGGKSGSPTQRDVTCIPWDCICLTLENIWTVADTLTSATSGLMAIGFVCGMVEEEDEGVDCKQKDDDEDEEEEEAK